jgi:hypothetical protein
MLKLAAKSSRRAGFSYLLVKFRASVRKAHWPECSTSLTREVV